VGEGKHVVILVDATLTHPGLAQSWENTEDLGVVKSSVSLTECLSHWGTGLC
jgi:hypothetical protein